MEENFIHNHVLQSEEPIENILRQLGSLRSHNIGDVKIVCKDGTVVAHKIILAAVSGLFQRVFSNNVLDETISVIAPDIDRNDVMRCLDALYNRREVSRDETFINLICGHLPPVAQIDFNILEETKIEEVESDDDDWADYYEEGEREEEEGEGEETVEQPLTPRTADSKVSPINVGEKKKGAKRSIVWKYFLRVSQKRYISVCSCLLCGQHVKSYGGTTTRLLKHLKVYHPGYESLGTVGGQDFQTGTQTPTIIKFTAKNIISPFKAEDPEENILNSDPENSADEDEEDNDSDYIDQQKKGKLRSVIWLHFRKNPKDRFEGMCNRCGKIIKMPSMSNTHLFRHLKKYHMGRDEDILNHFYEGSSKSTSTCIHCGHVVKHKLAKNGNPLYGLVLHMLSMHEDIFDRNQYMMNKGVSREKVEKLPVVEPKFDNFEDAREHFKALDKTKKPEEKKEKEKNYAWQYFIKHPPEGESKVGRAVCQLCNKSYRPKVRNLQKHLDEEHQICDPVTGPGSHVCAQCGKGFNTGGDLWTHERTHREKLRIPCTLCEKSFEQPGGLRRHMMSHTGEKPFQE